ncbi:MAG: hypothetical protein IKX84_05115, partial [Clostridia bacterium]|nr:hypothetical protein [Clostridia bacterium]
MKNDSAFPAYLTGGRARAMGAFLIAEGILGSLMIPLGLLLGWGAAEGGRLLKLLGWPDLGFGNAPAFICAFLSVWCGAAALITAIGAAGLMRGRKAAFQFLQAGCGQKCAICLAAALAALALQAMRLIGNSQVMSRKNIAVSAAVLALSAAGFALGFLYRCGALRAVRRARLYANGSAPSRKPAARHTADIAVWLGCALALGAAATVGLKYSLSRVYSYRALGQFLQSYWQIAAFGLFAAAGRFFVAAGLFREMKEAVDKPASLRPEDTHKSLTVLGIFGALSLLWLSFMGASELVNSWEWTSRTDILLAVLKIAAFGLMAAGLLCRSKKASAAFLALGCVLYLGLSVRDISDAV